MALDPTTLLNLEADQQAKQYQAQNDQLDQPQDAGAGSGGGGSQEPVSDQGGDGDGGTNPFLRVLQSIKEGAGNVGSGAMDMLRTGAGNGVLGALSTALAGAAGYATRNPELQTLASREMEAEGQRRILAPVGAVLGQAQMKLANGDIQGAMADYQKIAHLGIQIPAIQQFGTHIAEQAFALAQRRKIGQIMSVPDREVVQRTEASAGSPAEPAVAGTQPGPGATREDEGPVTVGTPGKEAVEPTPGTTTIRDNREAKVSALMSIGMEPDKALKAVYPELEFKDSGIFSKRTGEQVGNMPPGSVTLSPDQVRFQWNPITRHMEPIAMGLPAIPAEMKQFMEPSQRQAYEHAYMTGDMATADQIFKKVQQWALSPKTDAGYAKIGLSLGITPRARFSEYTPDEATAILKEEQRFKNETAVKAATERATAMDRIEQSKGWQDAYSGRHGKEVLYDITGGVGNAKRILDNRPYNNVAPNLGTKTAFLDKDSADVTTFAQRGLKIVDRLSDVLPQMLASGDVHAGDNLETAFKTAINLKLLPTEAMGEFKALSAATKFEAGAVDSRGKRLLASVIKQIGEDQIPQLTDTLDSAFGKLKVIKWGLTDMLHSTFGTDNPYTIQNIPMGTVGGIVMPRGGGKPLPSLTK